MKFVPLSNQQSGNILSVKFYIYCNLFHKPLELYTMFLVEQKHLTLSKILFIYYLDFFWKLYNIYYIYTINYM